MESVGKIVIIVQNLPVPFDRRVWLEANTLSDASYDVTVICPKGKHGQYQASHEVIDGIHIYRYPSPPDANNTVTYLLEFVYCWLMTTALSFKIWLTNGIDVIHACNPPETYFLLGIFFKIFGVKFVFDHHDLSPEMYLAKNGKPGSLLYRGLIWLERQTFRTADVVIATNLSHKKIAQERGDVEEERIFIVRSGPDFERLQLREPEIELKGGFRYLACYLGEMCPQDGVDYLLEAAHYLIFDLGRTDLKFILMGGGSAFNELIQQKCKLGLDPYVEFTGRVSDDDLCRYLSTADICLDPDTYSEWADRSTMNKIMEYMAFGKPIVAFDLRENRFSAQDAAAYAEPDDTRAFASLINELLNDPDKRKTMGEIGLERVRTVLAWNYSIPTLLAAYQRLFAVNTKSEWTA